MKPFISTTFFGYTTYLLALVSMASPWLFGFVHPGGAALFFPLIFGWFCLIMAIFSRSKAGAVGIFPIQMHCTLLTIVGFVIMMSPFLYDFEGRVFLPHVIIGATTLFFGVFTKTSPLTCPPTEMFTAGAIQSGDSLETRLDH